MRISLFILSLLLLTFVSCKDEELSLFEETADERVEKAINDLKNKLTAPEFGWLLKYRPEEDAGSYNVLLEFDENNKVNIKTDLGANDGEFYDQTISYRIDNSLGLELIFETYSFFSFLFEQDQTTFGAEFEFEFINETPDNALVFVSKSDRSVPSRIVFQPATNNAENLLGKELTQNLNEFRSAVSLFNPVLKLNYEDRDLAVFMRLDNLRRTLRINYIARKTNINEGQQVDFFTGYLIQADSIIFDEPFSINYDENQVSLSSIQLTDLSETTIDVCPEPADSKLYQGKIPGTDEGITLVNSLFDIEGKTILNNFGFFVSPLSIIFDESDSTAEAQIVEDIPGALDMQLYYFNDNNPFYAIGFRVENSDNSFSWLLKEFTPQMDENRLMFDFADSVSVFGNQNPETNVENVNIYLDLMTKENNTYISRINQNFIELYNPCSKWRFVFQIVN